MTMAGVPCRRRRGCVQASVHGQRHRLPRAVAAALQADGRLLRPPEGLRGDHTPRPHDRWPTIFSRQASLARRRSHSQRLRTTFLAGLHCHTDSLAGLRRSRARDRLTVLAVLHCHTEETRCASESRLTVLAGSVLSHRFAAVCRRWRRCSARKRHTPTATSLSTQVCDF